MKTFLFSLPARLKSFNDKLDVKGALCGKSWEVFNDEGVRQLFIFNRDGTLLITNNGRVIQSSWQYISANSSIIITSGDDTTMFRPAFYDKIVFALQQDGVERYLFMIDERQKDIFPEITLDALEDYFRTKERLAIEAEQKRDPEYIEALRRQKIAEDIRKQEEEEKKEREEEEKKRKETARLTKLEEQNLSSYLTTNIEKLLNGYEQRKKVSKTVLNVSTSLIVFCLILAIVLAVGNKGVGIIVLAITVLIVVSFICLSISKEKIEDYLRYSYETDNHTRLEYLKADHIKDIYEKL